MDEHSESKENDKNENQMKKKKKLVVKPMTIITYILLTYPTCADDPNVILVSCGLENV